MAAARVSMTRILLVSVESSPSAKEPPSVTKGSRPFPSARVKTLLLRKKNAACSNIYNSSKPNADYDIESFTGTTTITLKKGQYLELSFARIVQ